jgi:hypothetical protein
MDTANKILAESTPIKPYFEINFFPFYSRQTD